MIREKIEYSSNVKDDTPTPQCNSCVATTLIWFIDNIAFVSNAKIE